MQFSQSSFGRRLGVVALAATMALALLGAPAVAQEDQQVRFIEKMSKYLDFSTRFTQVAERPRVVLLLTVEAIVDTHRARGEGAKAIPHLRRLLEQTEERAARNILRLKLLDLLNEYGRTEEALEELDKMFMDNKRGRGPRPNPGG